MNPVQSTAIFAVSDVVATVRFYCDKLGFKGEWLWGEPVCFGGVKWGDVEIMFNQQPELAARIAGHEHFLRFEEVDSLHARHQQAGVEIVSPIDNKPWGLREYTVRDINGYHLRLAGPANYVRPAGATDILPANIRIEPRLPDLDTFARLFREVGWNYNIDSLRDALQNSVFGVLAIDGATNEIIGMTRIVGDGQNYTIWDVIVTPPYQGKRIGTALMQTALDHLRTIGRPGAWVGLFTPKPNFYKRLGFSTDAGGMFLRL